MSLGVLFYDNDLGYRVEKDVRFAIGLLRNAEEAREVWLELRPSYWEGSPDPSLPPVGERACRELGASSATWLRKATELLISFYENDSCAKIRANVECVLRQRELDLEDEEYLRKYL